MLSQTTEYALRAIVWLGSHPNEPQVTQQIADGTCVPQGYLSKVLQMLGRAGLVNAQRGLHGGFTLTRPPEEMCVLDVINAVDPLKRIDSCPLRLESHGKMLCPLHRRLDAAIAQVQDAFAKTSISEVLSDTTTSIKALCESK